MSEPVHCNVCLFQENTLVKKGVFGNPDQNVFKCARCGHFYLAPLLGGEEEERFYINDYPAFLLKRGDFKSSSPEEYFEKNKDEAERRFNTVKSWFSSDKSVLEIGSANGFFLHFIKPFSKTVCGVEPNEAYAHFANRIGVETHQNLNNIGNRKFDLVFLYYVLEHIKSPVDFIANIKGLLNDETSRMVVEVPNVNEALVSLYKSKAYDEFVWQRAHCSYFSVATLDKLFSDQGLTATFIPVQRYDFSNHIHWLIDGKPGGMGKYTHIFSEKLTEEYRGNLMKAWLCDSILAIVGPGNSRKEDR